MKIKYVFLTIGLYILAASCSINRIAINAVSDALAGSGSADVFASDPDPELVGDALPFALKMYEVLLSQNPDHQGLLLTTGSLFIMYANAYVQGPAEMLDPIYDYEEQTAGLMRAKALYLRGHEILYSALDKKYPGFSTATVQDGTLQMILARCKAEDVPLLYWSVAGGLSAYSIDIFDFNLALCIPEWDAMIARAYALDPGFNNGAIDDFYILYYSSLGGVLGIEDPKAKAEEHFRLAVEKSRGLAAGPYVSYAMSICRPEQDYDAFRENLEMALAIDPDEDPSNRLVNIHSQRRARHLLDTAYEHFSFLPYGWEEDYY